MKYIFLLLLLFSATTYAQRGERGEKIKAYKLAHITEALDLTPSEAEKFWPVYNQHEDTMHSLRSKMRKEGFGKRVENIDGLSETQALEVIQKGLKFKEDEIIANRKFVETLKGILPATKILKLHRAEESFKRMLLKRMRGGKEGKRN